VLDVESRPIGVQVRQASEDPRIHPLPSRSTGDRRQAAATRPPRRDLRDETYLLLFDFAARLPGAGPLCLACCGDNREGTRRVTSRRISARVALPAVSRDLGCSRAATGRLEPPTFPGLGAVAGTTAFGGGGTTTWTSGIGDATEGFDFLRDILTRGTVVAFMRFTNHELSDFGPIFPEFIVRFHRSVILRNHRFWCCCGLRLCELPRFRVRQPAAALSPKHRMRHR
jgi:hypothetical protein